ncbi:MAG: alanine racemase [Actinomycetes bacterium]
MTSPDPNREPNPAAHQAETAASTRYAPPLGPAHLPHGPLNALRATPIEARAFPETPLAPDDVATRGWTRDDLWQPVVVLDQDAIRHNVERMASWCATRGMSLAPHGKTTMAPQLWDRQLAAGAWGVTAANAAQARVMRRFGVPRVLIANEVVDPHGLAWLVDQLQAEDVEVLCCVDSVQGVERLEEALAAAGAERPQPVLVELGVPGRRTGCRDVDDLVALARRASRSGRLRVAGVEGYEGVLPQGRDLDEVAAARAFCAELTRAAERCEREGLLAGDERVVSGGGSAFFDLVADAVDEMADLSAPVRPVLRSGCYLTHDHMSYERSSPWRSSSATDPLRPALVAYATVLSVPEPGLALAGMGKRDVPYDLDMPVVLGAYREGTRTDVGEVTVTKLNDQHAFCATGAPPGLEVGDVLEMGLSHPCTTFDKWTMLPVVDSAGTVVDGVRTLF